MTDNRITEQEISQLIPEFYHRVRADPVLGPIFNDAISDWPEHLETLQAFWSSIILGSGRYKGQPLASHLLHESKMTLENFERWLTLWRKTTDDLLSANHAAQLQAKANRIAESLRLGVEFHSERAAMHQEIIRERTQIIDQPVYHNQGLDAGGLRIVDDIAANAHGKDPAASDDRPAAAAENAAQP